MYSRRIIWICAIAGSWIGGYIPLIWGAGYFSFSSILFNALGATFGIWIGFKLTH